MSPYNYCAGNPVKLVDVDGRAMITTDENGNVISVENQDGPNIFEDYNGNILSFNDSEEVDNDMLSKNFEVGDRVYMPMSREKSEKRIQNVEKTMISRIVFMVAILTSLSLLILMLILHFLFY